MSSPDNTKALTEKQRMARTLRVLFRRDPARDRQLNEAVLEGYEVLWPDGRPLSVGFDAFCKQGQRLLGLGRHLAGCSERLVDMICIHLTGREDRLTRLPGHRVRRFFLRRNGREARLHFLDGTATAILLDLDRDEPRVLDWTGLFGLDDGQELWIDLTARAVDSEVSSPTPLEGYPCPASV